MAPPPTIVKTDADAVIDTESHFGAHFDLQEDVNTISLTVYIYFFSIQFNLFHTRIILHDMGQVKD
jgi:hypothetical protein